jgi:hypothetical protein
MKQTAVIFLKKHIEADAIALYNGFMTFTEFMDKLDVYYSKAKEMEKQQKEVAYQSGYLDCYTKLMSENLTRKI